MSKYPICVPFAAGGGDYLFACDAQMDYPKDDLMAAFLNEKGYSLADITDDEWERLLGCLVFQPLYSVVKADWDDLGDEGDGGWHTGGSGKRRRDVWWVERVPFFDLIDDITERKQSECAHENIHQSGYW